MRTFNFKGLMTMCVIAATAMAATSCSQDDDFVSPEGKSRAANVVTINAGMIPADQLNWTADTEYRLNGKVAVPVGKTLTIAAGTKVVGVTKADPKEASALIVPRGAKIEAVGTASNPIVMTASNGTKGGWGGIVLLGKAPINQSGDVYIEGIDPEYLPDVLKMEDFRYGGTDANDNSGKLQYVRVEYAGASISADNELNAFTFGGVGAGTTLNHLQAYYGADDAFEFFGGTVCAKYLVSTATDDDAFDFDFGYTGKIQFAVSTIDPAMSYSKDPNGIECDNDGSSSAKTPYTHPVLSNLTIVGTSTGSAASALKSCANFRRNCQFTLVNSILYGFPKGILKETNNSFVLKNNIVASIPAGNEFCTFTPDASNVAKAVSEIGLTSPWGAYKNTINLKPKASPATDHADFSMLDSWFTTTSYVGAIPQNGANWLMEQWIK